MPIGIDMGHAQMISAKRCWLCSSPLELYTVVYTCEEIACFDEDCPGHSFEHKRCINWKLHDKHRQETLEMAKQQDEEMARAGKA